jgi:hypothetical protein
MRVHFSLPFILSLDPFVGDLLHFSTQQLVYPSQAREFVNMPRMSLALVVGWATIVSGLMQFINPPPSGATQDFSNSETYKVGNTVNVAWTPAESGNAASLVLYQLDSNGLWFGDMEYLTRRLS